MPLGLDICDGELAALIIFTIQTVVLLLAFYNPRHCCQLICNHAWGLLTTIYDESTDIGVLVSWYYLSTKENKIDEINMLAWFLMLLGIILVERIINIIYILRKITMISPVFAVLFGLTNFVIASVIGYDWKTGGCCQCFDCIYQSTSASSKEAERQISIDIINARQATVYKESVASDTRENSPAPASDSSTNEKDQKRGRKKNKRMRKGKNKNNNNNNNNGSIKEDKPTLSEDDANNAILNTKKKMISKLLFNEAVWEGIPQIVLQSVFLIRTYSVSSDVIDSNDTRLVWFSLLGSFLVVISKYATALHAYRTEKQIIDRENIDMGKYWHTKIFYLVSIFVRVSIYILLWSVLGFIFVLGFVCVCITFYILSKVVNCFANCCIDDDSQSSKKSKDEMMAEDDDDYLHYMTKLISNYVYHDLFGCAAKFNLKPAETKIDYDSFQVKVTSLPLFYCQWAENLLFALFAVLLDAFKVVNCKNSLLFECVDESVNNAGDNVIYTIYFSVTFALLIAQMILLHTI